jgi:hypothetical protein
VAAMRRFGFRGLGNAHAKGPKGEDGAS